MLDTREKKWISKKFLIWWRNKNKWQKSEWHDVILTIDIVSLDEMSTKSHNFSRHRVFFVLQVSFTEFQPTCCIHIISIAVSYTSNHQDSLQRRWIGNNWIWHEDGNRKKSHRLMRGNIFTDKNIIFHWFYIQFSNRLRYHSSITHRIKRKMSFFPLFWIERNRTFCNNLNHISRTRHKHIWRYKFKE
jgi:hypothetical protein